MITVWVNVEDHWISLESPEGFTLMQCLKSPENNGKIIAHRDNILGSCGGNMSCSTCIVKVHENFIDYLPFPEDNELMLLDIFLDQQGLPYSEGIYRLSCQIVLNENINGLKIYLV